MNPIEAAIKYPSKKKLKKVKKYIKSQIWYRIQFELRQRALRYTYDRYFAQLNQE